MRNDFAIFILSHGRADRMLTVRALKRLNYTGRWYVVIDDEDETAQEYYNKFGDHVIMFSKAPVVAATDTMDIENEHRAIVYARNKCFDIAQGLGLKYFQQLDDDVVGLSLRKMDGEHLRAIKCPNYDIVVNAMIDFLDATNALTVAFCQAGDFIGGVDGVYSNGILRKAMNSFFCRTDRRIEWLGTMNEDVTTYTLLGSRGELFLSPTCLGLVPVCTQSISGGMTEVYKEQGTYQKSFYSVMAMPSCVEIGFIKWKNARIHHNINWEHCVPKIISEIYKK